MGSAFDEEVCGLTELASGSQDDAPYFRQGPECPTDDCASWGTSGLIYFFVLFLFFNSERASAARRSAPPHKAAG
jgi:hypothetical protein